jgi:multiple antibiotic resistance protein
MFDFPSIITAFIALFIVMDPFSSVPVYMSLTKKLKPEARESAARVAGIVALGVLLGFLFLGPIVLSFMNIRFESFQIAGGVLMFVIALTFALGVRLGEHHEAPIEAVIIGVPLLSGPGTMLTSMLLANTLGVANVAVAGALACAASYLVLVSSSLLHRLVGKKGLEILSRVMGVLLAAFAVEFIRRGLGL